MSLMHWVAMIALFFVPAGEKQENPWKDKVAAAVEQARSAGTAGAYREALDVTWRADDWEVGLELAREALQSRPNASEVHGPAARALWRAGRIAEAEDVAARLSVHWKDPIALKMLITTALARGDKTTATRAADRLHTLTPLSGEDLFYVINTRAAAQRLDGLADLIRQAEKKVDVANGYPEIYLAEQLEGLAEYFDAIGPKPVNQIRSYGSSPMPVITLINLPGCEVMINGHGPYRMIVDTGGSIMLSLDSSIAAELSLESIAQSSVHGVAGKDESGQVLIDELRIGDVVCHRVMSRTFGVRKSIAYAADGIIGTGLFGDGRMTLDFQEGRLTVQPSSSEPGPGSAADLRIVADAKLIAPIPLNGEPAAALIDSGADAFAVAPSRLRKIFPGEAIRTLPAAGAFGVGGDQNPAISLTRGVDFRFAGRDYQNYGGLGLDVLDTLLGPMLGIQNDALIGMPVLREMKTLTVDFPQCKMWVEWLKTE